MEFHFKPMTDDAANAIASWHYDGCYSFYDMEQDPEDLTELLDPADRDKYSSVYDSGGELAGYFYLEKVEYAVEVGLGLRPDITGKGLGLGFVEAGLEYAHENYSPKVFRLSVAAFNQRAIRVYERVGFQQVETYLQETNGGRYAFVRMEKRQ